MAIEENIPPLKTFAQALTSPAQNSAKSSTDCCLILSFGSRTSDNIKNIIKADINPRTECRIRRPTVGIDNRSEHKLRCVPRARVDRPSIMAHAFRILPLSHFSRASGTTRHVSPTPPVRQSTCSSRVSCAPAEDANFSLSQFVLFAPIRLCYYEDEHFRECY
ncbi:hypothetical protein CEXT_717051 [Caerostris extrusa]|uniref:Uncharacterized protein n=1 Tax=Caerostris extrusa TaxID=172846 RepID=A0AAV4Q9Z8_CAEEX|nr:hypothetical protein CEXT_717051 [Caerostris extrusa]